MARCALRDASASRIASPRITLLSSLVIQPRAPISPAPVPDPADDAHRIPADRQSPTARDATCGVRDVASTHGSMRLIEDACPHAWRWTARARLACIDDAARCARVAVSEHRWSARIAMTSRKPLRRRISVYAPRERVRRTSMRASSLLRAALAMHLRVTARSLCARRARDCAKCAMTMMARRARVRRRGIFDFPESLCSCGFPALLNHCGRRVRSVSDACPQRCSHGEAGTYPRRLHASLDAA